jgi:hypothetical protein
MILQQHRAAAFKSSNRDISVEVLRSPNLYPPPLWLGCDLEKPRQIRQLLDLRGHDGILGGVVIAGGLSFMDRPAQPGRAAAGGVWADDFPLPDQPRGKFGRATALAG